MSVNSDYSGQASSYETGYTDRCPSAGSDIDPFETTVDDTVDASDTYHLLEVHAGDRPIASYITPAQHIWHIDAHTHVIAPVGWCPIALGLLFCR